MFDGKKAFDFVQELSFPRPAGSEEEYQAVQMIAAEVESLGLQPRIDEFDTWRYWDANARLQIVEPFKATFPASAIGLTGSTPEEGLVAPLVYVESGAKECIGSVKGTIALATGNVRAESYETLKARGAVGFVVVGGPGRGLLNLAIPEGFFARHGKLPGARILHDDGLAIIKRLPCTAKLVVKQQEALSKSHNVWTTITGTTYPDEVIVVGAHLDSVPGVPGACDNAAGSATVLELARYFVNNPPRRTMTFAWFGTEELGLVGSFKYVEAHREELARAVMMFNLDVGGGIIGQNFATVMGPEKLLNYVEAMGAEYGMALTCESRVASSDSTPFSDTGIPTVGFSRSGGALSQYMHTSQDSLDYIDEAHLAMIGDFSLEFLRRMVGALKFPFEKTVPQSIKDEMKRYKKNNLGMVVD